MLFRSRDAIEDYQGEISSMYKDLEALKDEGLKDLDDALMKSQASIVTFESYINDKKMAKSRLTTALQDARNCLDALLKKFRTENEIYRNNLERPRYFNDFPILESLDIADFNIESDLKELSRQQLLVENLLSEEQDIRAKIQAAFTKKFDNVKSLDFHFSRKVSS